MKSVLLVLFILLLLSGILFYYEPRLVFPIESAAPDVQHLSEDIEKLQNKRAAILTERQFLLERLNTVEQRIEHLEGQGP